MPPQESEFARDFFSENISAVKPNISAPGSRQASRGNPAFTHVSSSSRRPDHFRSVATCGSKSPLQDPRTTINPCCPATIASGRMRSGTVKTEISISNAATSSARIGANRESNSAALIAERATTSASGPGFSTCPTQPRSASARYRLTNAPLGSESAAGKGREIVDALIEDGACYRTAGNSDQRQPIVTGQSGHPGHSCAVREFSGDAAASRCHRHGPKTFENIETRKPPRFPPRATTESPRAAG